MGKAKKNRKPLADTIYTKKSNAATISNPFALAKPSTAKRLNPFEVHVNKEKFQILGRTCKHDKGLPGVSRAKAIKRRKQTLGLEYQDKHKANKFQDRRIGKHLNADEITDEVLNARFLADKLTEFKGNKLSKFNLNDDEVLTHRGTTLEEIEQFRDEGSDDEEAGDEQLDADFIEAAHFGGGSEPVKDRKTAIEEMILEQKKRKIEIAKEKDELYDLTDKLDSNYKELMPLMGKMTKTGDKEKAPQDDFDKIMREMIFEPRSAVSDKLQSEEEVAKKEKERLEKLEQERLKRMLGENEETEGREQAKHRSADDLDDGYFAYEDQNDAQNDTLSYNLHGELDKNQSKNKNEAKDENENTDVEETDDENVEEAEEEGENESENGNEESDEDSEDDLSDLKAESSDESDEETNTSAKSKETISKVKSKNEKVQKLQNDSPELPFTIDMPAKYEEFFKLLNPHQTRDQATIVERIIKCNHPKLEGVNREKVIKLFAFLLQYINELFSEATAENVTQHFQLLDKLNPHLFDLMHLNAERTSTIFLDVIKEKYASYCKQPTSLPTLETLVFFKLVSNFFTTSDFRHPVVSPCFIFIEHMLTRSRLRTRQDIAAGLFLTTIALEYTQQSKRFLPASFNFLLGTLFLSLPKRAVEVIKIIPPFKPQGPLSQLLVLNDTEKDEVKLKHENQTELLKSEDLLTESINSDFKVRALNATLCLMNEFTNVIGENVGSNYLAKPLLEMLIRLPIELYPNDVQTSFETIKESLIALTKKSLTKLVPPEKKPKALRLLEPRFEAVYDDKRRPKMSKEKEERAKLLHKVKRETKGAVREIRRDTEFVQKMRLQQQIKSDRERHEKVKRILHEASMQQGELNELARAKKRKKF